MSKYLSAILSTLASAILLLSSLILGASTANAQEVEKPKTTQEQIPSLTRFFYNIAKAQPIFYVVRPGDSLSAIAKRLCSGQVNDWTGIFKANRSRVSDPNLILPGWPLKIECSDPPSLLHLASPTVPVHGSHGGGKVQGLAYGHPNFCGDGDGDGWDVPCQTRQTRTSRATGAISHFVASASHYSFSGLESLWVSAGGPSWASAHAAEIAECESGGNVFALNPSGATGLWQILGSVVPGNLYNAFINALNAVSKFKASGDTFAQWVCK